MTINLKSVCSRGSTKLISFFFFFFLHTPVVKLNFEYDIYKILKIMSLTLCLCHAGSILYMTSVNV